MSVNKTTTPKPHRPAGKHPKASGWGALLPLAKLIVSKEIDGFWFPHEFRGRVPDRLPDGSPLDVFSSAGGRLVMAAKRHSLYGYDSRSDFAKAVVRKRVEVATASGAVTLGALRATVPSSFTVTLRTKALPVDVVFSAASSDEAVEISRIVRRAFPGSETRITDGSLAATTAFLPSPLFLFRKLQQQRGPDRSCVHLIWAGALVAVMVGLLPWAFGWSFLIAAMAPLLFFLVMMCAFMGRTRILRGESNDRS